MTNNGCLINRLSAIRAILHECEAILLEFQEGKQSGRTVTSFASPKDSDPVKARKGISKAIVEIDKLRAEADR